MPENTLTVVLVHGAFADASSFARVVPELLDDGLKVLVPAVPNRSLLGDAAYIASVRQIDGPVVLVGHSYGGAVITVAGLEENVKALVFVSAYALERAHFFSLCQNSVELPPEAMAMLGRATVQLIRALITTAADDARQHEALHSTQLLRITMYIDAHLHDPELNADRIAAAHNISPRQLYNVWARAGHDLTPSQWIIRRRLERARNQLTDLDPQVTTIAAIAHGCGFANLSHFSQRFRAAYGMSPREWRWISRADA